MKARLAKFDTVIGDDEDWDIDVETAIRQVIDKSLVSEQGVDRCRSD